ncbi:hypothetical protein [Mycoplana ramosa]|uniref:Helix-turn-helix domain-containing protein n=1 Tax=Mycoplana ramosa TaxID=40837 RepID=A0ABW3YWI8_MYCRA
MSDARFSIIPGWIVTDPRLKGRDLQVLCLLGRHTSRKHGWCRRSQVKMAEELSCARSTVQASIDRLVEIGGVERREVISENGRDSAHWYRVVYDIETPEAVFDGWDRSDAEEFNPISAEGEGATPAGIPAPPADISAPPAGSGSAPPADSGPAPINDSCLTPDDLPREKAHARDETDEEESPKALERRFRQWWSRWPTFEADDETRTRSAWNSLSPQQRRECEEKTPIWLERVLGKGGKGGMGRTMVKKASTYLTQRMWERVPDAVLQAATNPPTLHKPFSKAWQGRVYAVLLGPERSPPPMTRTLEAVVRGGGPMADLVRKQHRQQHAWPDVARMYGERQGTAIPADIVAISEDFRSYHVGSPEVAAWRRLHDRMGWAWPDMGKAEWICLPPTSGGDDDAALAALERYRDKLREVRGDEHAA